MAIFKIIIVIGVGIIFLIGAATCSAFFFKSSRATPEPFPELPYLEYATGKQGGHEVVRLVARDGYGVRYIASNKTFVLATALGYGNRVTLWRINQEGIIVDSFSPDGEYEGGLPATGIYFRRDNYIDWAFSGDKNPKKYLNTWRAHDLGVVDINQILVRADRIFHEKVTHYQTVYRGMNETYEHLYYLDVEGGWQLLIANEALSASSYPALAAMHERDAYEAPQTLIKSLVAMAPNLSLEQSPLRLKDFKKQGSSKSGFMDINSHAWVGDYGLGHYQLQVGNDVFDFKSYLRVLNGINSDYRENEPDMRYFDAAAEGELNNDLLFVQLLPFRNPARRNEELGTYIVRKKITSASIKKLTHAERDYVKNSQQKTPLNIEWIGFDAVAVNVTLIANFNGGVEYFNAENLATQIKDRALPMAILANFTFPIKERTTTKVVTNNKPDNHYYSYSIKMGDTYFTHSDTDNSSFTLRFDYDELLEVKAKLGLDSQVATLKLYADFVEDGVELKVFLANAKTAVPLQKVRFYPYHAQASSLDEMLSIFDKQVIADIAELNGQHDIVKNNPNRISAELKRITAMVNASEYPYALSYSVKNSIWFLLNAAENSNDPALPLAVANTYVAVFPKLVVTAGLQDLVKRLVEVAENTHNLALKQNIAETFFSQQSVIDFKASQWLLAQGFLDSLFLLAQSEPLLVPNYLWASQQVLTNNSEMDTLATAIAGHYTKLLIAALKANNFSQSKTIIETYMNTVYAITGYSEKSGDMISMSLVGAVMANDAKLLSRLMSEFIENKDYQLPNNNILHYNMACAYARMGDKAKMLAAIKNSIKFGHARDSFYSDSDFTSYVNDADFKAAVQFRIAE